MKKSRFFVFLSLLTLFLLTSASSQAALTGKEIMDKNEDARKILHLTSDALISTATGNAEPKKKNFTWWRKLSADQNHYLTLTRFHTPAEVRDEGILFIEKDANSSDVLLYLPTYKKIRRVETQSQSSSFMSSTFSYSDITSPHADEYSYSLGGSEKCPQTPSVQCFVIESTPANDSVRDKTGYSKSKLWIRQDNFMLEKAENTDLEGHPWKELIATQNTEVDPAHHKWMALKLQMTDLKSNQTTTLQFSKVDASTDIADSTFTQQKLSHP